MPPAALTSLTGVTVRLQSDTVVKVEVDTSRRSVRDVLDELLATFAVADLSVVDPPLEQVIAQIYTAPRPAAP